MIHPLYVPNPVDSLKTWWAASCTQVLYFVAQCVQPVADPQGPNRWPPIQFMRARADSPDSQWIEAADDQAAFRTKDAVCFLQGIVRPLTGLQCVGQQNQIELFCGERQGFCTCNQCWKRCRCISGIRLYAGDAVWILDCHPSMKDAAAAQARNAGCAKLQCTLTEDVLHDFIILLLLPSQGIASCWGIGEPVIQIYNRRGHECQTPNSGRCCTP